MAGLEQCAACRLVEAAHDGEDDGAALGRDVDGGRMVEPRGGDRGALPAAVGSAPDGEGPPGGCRPRSWRSVEHAGGHQ